MGKLLLRQQLPADMQEDERVLDKKGIKALFEELATKHPEQYADVNQRLHTLGGAVSTAHGREASVSLSSFRTPEPVKALRRALEAKIQTILDSKLTPTEKQHKIIEETSAVTDQIEKTNFDEHLKANNPLALQVLSGSRGNKSQLRSMTAGDLLVVDHKDNPIPIPITRSFSEGLDPVQYWAGSYGARKGAISTKFATPKSGYLGKQLAMAAHRLLVTEKDCGTSNGISMPANDPDNEGAVLAADAGEYKAGTVLTPRMLKELGDTKIRVRSTMTCTAEKGLCQRCAGIRERGGFPPIGDNIGVAAAHAISEPIGQGQLSVKHTGGLAQKTSLKQGLDLVNQIVQVPTTFPGAATISGHDGRVDKIEDAPQGGKYIHVAGHAHYASADQNLSVKPGQMVEAGDVMTDGIPNPAHVVEHKGIGEGRRYFAEQLHKTLKDGGFGANRRNVELLSRGLVNHVRVTDVDGPNDTVPDDIVEYDDLVRNYTPRHGFTAIHPKKALGLYLEQPVLHYSIGTRVTPRVASTLEENKIPSVMAHADPPSFVPEMTRAMETAAHADDWMVRMGGLYGVKRSVIKGVHRAASSQTHGTSFIPALAQGTEFGKNPEGKGY